MPVVPAKLATQQKTSKSTLTFPVSATNRELRFSVTSAHSTTPMSAISLPHSAKRKSSRAQRFFALRVEFNRLQLAIATLENDGVYSIEIDEITCVEPTGWQLANDSGLLEQAVSELLDRHQLRRQQVAVSLDADFCVTRVAMGAADVVDRELEMLRTRVPRYLQLGPGEKVTGFCRTRLAPGVEHVVTGVVNLRSLQIIYDAICSAEANVAWIEPSLVSVARLLGMASSSDEPILIADGSGVHWDLGIAYQGQLLLDYRPAGASDEAALSAALDGHISRLRRFCHRHRGITSSELNKLSIYGEHEKLSRTMAVLGDRNQIEVSVLNVPDLDQVYRIDTRFHSSKYVPVVAAIVPLLTNVSIDQIPDMLGRFRRTPDRPWPIQVAIAMLPVVAAFLFLMVAYGLVTKERRREQMIHASRAQMESQMQQTQLRLVELTGKKELLAQLERVASQAADPRWDLLMTRVAQCLPDTVRLNEIRVDIDGIVRIDGATIDETLVYEVVDQFRRLPDISQVALQGTMPESQSEGIRFIVRLTTSSTNQPN